MEKLVVFNDFANVNAAYQQQNMTPDYRDLLRYLSEGRFLVEAHAFVPIDPRNPHARDQIMEDLWSQGYLVRSKVGALAGDSYRCDFDVEITLELMRTAELVKPDIIVIISGDKDSIPVIIELRRRGIRIEVAAFPGVNAAQEVILKGSGFIDLHRYLQERQEQDQLAQEDLASAATFGDDWEDPRDDEDEVTTQSPPRPWPMRQDPAPWEKAEDQQVRS